jgi:maleate isomerase
MTTAADIAQAFDAILRDLRAETNASRTTLRLDWPAFGFHVDDPAGEAVAPGEKSLRGQTSINQREAATVKWLDAERRLLIQDDLDNAVPAAPPALLAVYGAKAQLLAPIIRDDALQGWISIHQSGTTRHWGEAEKAAIEKAVARAIQVIEGQ